MSCVKTNDGVEIFYKDWGPKDAQPIHFHHGWPLSSDDWGLQMPFFLQHGYRMTGAATAARRKCPSGTTWTTTLRNSDVSPRNKTDLRSVPATCNLLLDVPLA